MYYCLFFFFKQKTAYEMRISDWSSDVCSSDLSSSAVTAVLLMQAVVAQQFSFSAYDVYGTASPASTPVTRSWSTATLPFTTTNGMPSEIGRASGRERVCQYV